MKQKENRQQTEFEKRILALLSEKGYKPNENSEVAIFTDNNTDIAKISVNCMSTGIHLPKSEVSQTETEAAGFKWYPTWNWGTN